MSKNSPFCKSIAASNIIFVPINRTIEMAYARFVLFCVALLNLCANHVASAQSGPAAPCGPYSSDTSVITCWLRHTDRIPHRQGWEEAMPILRALSGHTAEHPLMEAHRLIRMSRLFANKMMYDSGLYCLTVAGNLYLQTNDFKGSAAVEDNMGTILLGKSEWDKAAPHFYKAVEWADKAQADTLKVLPYINLAHIFETLGDQKQERHFLSKAYDIAKKYNNAKLTAIAGVSLMMSHIETSDLDSARAIANHVMRHMQGNQAMKACSYYALAVWESAQGNWRTADGYYLKMKTDPDMPEHFRHTFSYAYANFLADRKLYEKAQPIYEDVIAKARKYQRQGDLHDVLEKYHAFLATAKDYKRAYEVAVEYMAVHDSTHRLQMEESVRDINIKYETAEKEKALQTSKLALSEKTNQRNLLLGGLVLLALLGSMAFFWQRNRVQLTQHLRDRDAQIAQQKIAQLKREQEHLAFKAMASGEEAERNRLARELHDGLGGILSGIKLALTARKKDGVETEHRATVDMVDKAGSELRRIAQNLMPESLAKFGLVAALEDLCADLEHYAGLQTSFQHYGLQQPLPEPVVLPVYRIVQEALNNIVKHAQATEVMVELILENQQLHLTIEDNGIGFRPESEADFGGQGIKNIQSRVDYLHGSIELDRTPDHGATINITIPIP